MNDFNIYNIIPITIRYLIKLSKNAQAYIINK